MLEDEAQRINLTGDIPVDDLVTGIAIALMGYTNDDGKFHVEECCFAGEYPSFSTVTDNGIDDLPGGDDRYNFMDSSIHFVCAFY